MADTQVNGHDAREFRLRVASFIGSVEALQPLLSGKQTDHSGSQPEARTLKM
jgi:hypothetical protein